MQQPVPVLNFKDFISAHGDNLTTTSLQVAAAFGKKHKHVLDKIAELISELPEDFNEPNFRPVDYVDLKGERRPAYRLTRDGFSLLTMGFSGRKALSFKVAYIQAFNAMAAFIKNQCEGLQYQYLAKELEYKTRRTKVSACAREMRHWRDDKPLIEDRLSTLLIQMQPDLLT